ncbi:hypothetical protein [Novosphingobium pokkalii]|jgi:hypothetical protein|uniref:Secreted protein n=1 Tax=Novosphingobium pokkalii TaxID=1770194 RepID=A0ABV7V3T1_9SPHN|nr:hypothetical protein [Novosphingobium pokkalii]GHC91735.1 hypothetical protein GCM10019060_17090 [Novosphingobium pokkalii]
MNIMKIGAIGVVASLLVAGTAEAAGTQAAVPVASVTAKKLVRSSAPVARQSKSAEGVVLGLAAVGAIGVGVYEVTKSDSTGS